MPLEQATLFFERRGQFFAFSISRVGL
jgi:hypothetical protein